MKMGHGEARRIPRRESPGGLSQSEIKLELKRSHEEGKFVRE